MTELVMRVETVAKTHTEPTGETRAVFDTAVAVAESRDKLKEDKLEGRPVIVADQAVHIAVKEGGDPVIDHPTVGIYADFPVRDEGEVKGTVDRLVAGDHRTEMATFFGSKVIGILLKELDRVAGDATANSRRTRAIKTNARLALALAGREAAEALGQLFIEQPQTDV